MAFPLSRIAFVLCIASLLGRASTSSAHQGTAHSLLGLQEHVGNLSFSFGRIHLDYNGRHPHESDRSLQTGSSNNTSVFRPIRFQFDTQAIESRRGLGYNSQIDYILTTVLPAVAATWSRHLHVVPNTQPISVNSSSCNKALHLQFPQVAPALLYNADIAIVVGGYDQLTDEYGNAYQLCVPGSGTLALALPCALDQVDRPALGFINFCLNQTRPSANGSVANRIQTIFASWLNTAFRDDQLTTHLVDVAVHETGHVLGFSDGLFKYFRDADGNPRTARPFVESTVTCPNGQTVTQVFPSTNTVKVLASTGGRRSYHMVTPRVTQVARNSLNCQTLQGARLDDSPTDCIASHWHERLFYGELMGPVYSSSSENVLSPLTLALMEDSGFYRVNYQGAKSPAFGLGAGCSFVNDECVIHEQIPDYANNTFCATPMQFTVTGNLDITSLDSVACDPSHHSWVTCDLYNLTYYPAVLTANETTNKIHYWSSPLLFSENDFADSCPVLDFGLGRDCTVNDPSYPAQFLGETTGSTSRCVSTFLTIGSVRRNRPACFQIVCDASTSRVLLSIGSQTLVCEWDGQVIAVPGQTPYNIICPKRVAVCPSLFSCLADCSGRGTCVYNATPPYCQCFAGEPNNGGCFASISSASYAPSSAPAPQPTKGVPSTFSPTASSGLVVKVQAPTPTLTSSVQQTLTMTSWLTAFVTCLGVVILY
jgi:hypothetical protein